MIEGERQTKEQCKTLARKIYNTPEGKIFITGLFLFVTYCLWLCVMYFLDPKQAQLKIVFSITRLFIGNPPGVFLGHAMGFSQRFILFSNMYIETVNIFIFYPLLTFIIQEFFNISALGSIKHRFLKNAETRQKSIKKYRILGLFIFNLFPIWGKGPIVGSLIGFLMKLKPWVNMSVVLSATYLVTIISSITSQKAHGFVLSFDSKAPLIFVLSVFAIIAGTSLFRRLKQKRKGI